MKFSECWLSLHKVASVIPPHLRLQIYLLGGSLLQRI